MKTVPLGQTGEDLSALCLGTMRFGSRDDEPTSHAMLDQYVQAGGRFLDTANTYAHWIGDNVGGESERLLGRWMQDRGNRDELFLATKVGFGYPGDDLGGAEKELTSEAIIAECDKSLQRLGTDRIDLYYAHNDDYDTPLAETLAAFTGLVRAGKVRYIGASNYLAWRLARALTISELQELAPYVAVQQRHTYLRPRPGHDWKLWPAATEEFLDCCAKTGRAVIAYSPLLGGAYTRDDKKIPAGQDWPDSQSRLEALRAVADQLGATPNQVVLAWMLHSDPVVIPLFSASTSEQMTENLGALEISLNDEQMTQLDQAGIA